MDLVRLLVELGGIADAAEILRVTTRHQLGRAVADGELVRIARGRYTLPGFDEHRAAAASVNGALDRLSAARHHGWKIKFPPEQPQVIVPRGRNVPAKQRSHVELRWGAVTPAELEAGVTSPERTALECARTLPFDAALAVVDSALRAGVSRGTLLHGCARLPRTGRSRTYRVVELADRRAANPFESVLRAILLDIPGADFEPQVWIGNIGRVDLVDRKRKLAIEADSAEFHSAPDELARDMVRYNALVAAGFLVLRFAWEHVMFEADYVRATVAGVLAAQERSVRGCTRCAAA